MQDIECNVHFFIIQQRSYTSEIYFPCHEKYRRKFIQGPGGAILNLNINNKSNYRNARVRMHKC